MGYTVKKGDNPSAIAKANGLTLQQLADYNPKYAKGILSGNINIGDTYNLSKKSGLFNRPQEDSQSIKPGAYYVNYPDYDVQTGLFDGKQRLGHSGVLLVDDNGDTSYYEYGRYDSGIGHLKPGEGNWRTKTISGKTLDEISQSLLASQPAGARTSNVRMTHVPADIEKVRSFITQDANNPNRRSYNIPIKDSCSLNDKTCASEASDAISAGWNASGVGKVVRSAIGVAKSILGPYTATGVKRAVGNLIPGGRGVTTPTPANYTSQDYEDKWNDRGYETYTYTSSNNR